MDIRRRMINTPPPTADNVFVIDNITFEEVNMWGISGYDMYIENINTIKSLKNFIVENGYMLTNSNYKIDPSQIELYLYDYKIPVSDVVYSHLTNSLDIYYQEGDATEHVITMPDDSHVLSPSGSGTWKFNYIPTTSVEAILFVEFAKQYGVDAIKIDGYSVNWYEEDKIIGIALQNSVICHIYGAGNGQFSGQIFRHDI